MPCRLVALPVVSRPFAEVRLARAVVNVLVCITRHSLVLRILPCPPVHFPNRRARRWSNSPNHRKEVRKQEEEKEEKHAKEEEAEQRRRQRQQQKRQAGRR